MTRLSYQYAGRRISGLPAYSRVGCTFSRTASRAPAMRGLSFLTLALRVARCGWCQWLGLHAPVSFTSFRPTSARLAGRKGLATDEINLDKRGHGMRFGCLGERLKDPQDTCACARGTTTSQSQEKSGSKRKNKSGKFDGRGRQLADALARPHAALWRV